MTLPGEGPLAGGEAHDLDGPAPAERAPRLGAQPPTIPLPVTCPHCGAESMMEFPALVVRVALTQWNQLALYATCHEGSWDATPTELEKIRRHVGQAWIDGPADAAAAPVRPGPRVRRSRRRAAV